MITGDDNMILPTVLQDLTVTKHKLEINNDHF